MLRKPAKIAAVLLLVLPIALVTAADDAKEKAKDETEKMQGTWNVVTLEVQGTKFSEPLFKGSKIVIKGDTFKTISPKTSYGGTFKVDAAASPKTIDMKFTEGPEKGKVSQGIYELDGDTWKLCLTIGATTQRPKEFATKPASGLALETLKRER